MVAAGAGRVQSGPARLRRDGTVAGQSVGRWRAGGALPHYWSWSPTSAGGFDMPNADTRLAVVVVLVVAAAVSACGGDDLDDATRERVVAAGDSAAMSLVRTLGGRLNDHLAAGGPAEAIAFCAGEAQALTDSVSDALGPGWRVKRTTLQTRNPGNAPDSLEAEALRYFHAAAEDETELPPHYVQATPDGDFRYYMPLQLGHMCLQCHGPRESLDPAVREVLNTRYPADQATGYAQGDFRGVVRVTVPREAVR